MTHPARLASLLVVALAACGGAKSTPAPTTPAEPAPTAAAPAAGSADPAAAAPAAPAAALPKTPGPNNTPAGVVFNYRADGKGKRIFLAGNFNEWNPSNDKFLMKDDDGDGIYTIVVKLAPGTYQYKYVIEGKWTKDPYAPDSAPDGYGAQNGKFEVK